MWLRPDQGGNFDGTTFGATDVPPPRMTAKTGLVEADRTHGVSDESIRVWHGRHGQPKMAMRLTGRDGMVNLARLTALEIQDL